jgi:glucose/arabinose dehydrogenase
LTVNSTRACVPRTLWFLALGFCLTGAAFGQQQAAAPASQTPPQPAELKVPAGFSVSVFASGLPGSRLMAVSPDGVVYVARQTVPGQQTGEVVALPDRDKDGKADKVEVVASGLTRPHSLAFHKGYLYIATHPAVMRMKYANGKVEGTPEKFVDMPPPLQPESHRSRTIAFGRDGRLYVSIGSSCNVCEEPDERRTTIMVYNADGTSGRPYARGVRNAIGIDFDPRTGVLWANDMGQDGLGDDFPPDEINRIEDGKHYGFPYFLANNQPNAGLTNAKGSLKASDATPAAFELQPHSSPIDLRFYTGRQFPAKYRGAMLLVLHGSGSSYKKERIPGSVQLVVFKNGKPVALEDFVTGFVKDGQVMGRPAGLTTGADGSLYISDDNKGFIYRVTYGGK